MTAELVQVNLSLLFEEAENWLEEFKKALGANGIEVAPDLRLERGEGLLCCYDLQGGCIYLTLPDASQPLGKLQTAFFRSVAKCDSNDELLTMMRLLLPRLIAHELGHCLRHQHGLFGENLWVEEQVANHFADALTKVRLTPEEKETGIALIERALAGVKEHIDDRHPALISYYSLIHALDAAGALDPLVVENVLLMHRALGKETISILEQSGLAPADFDDSMVSRRRVIAGFNRDYTQDVVEYIHLQLFWMLLDLKSRKQHYLDRLKYRYLGYEHSVLAPPGAVSENRISAETIQSYFCAHRLLENQDTVSSRYFYKRYRTCLLARLESVMRSTEAMPPDRLAAMRWLLQNWDDGEPDRLDFTAALLSEEMRSLLPGRIADRLPPEIEIEPHLVDETDIRLWEHATGKKTDPAAETTLKRLELLDRAKIYRPLPAEVLLALAESLCRLKLRAGQTVIWQGSVNYDLFILVFGALDVWVTSQGDATKIGTVSPGEVFGEMACFTRRPRVATVRAREPSECLVLNSSDLHLLAMKHPTVLAQMCSELALRLAALEKTYS